MIDFFHLFVTPNFVITPNKIWLMPLIFSAWIYFLYFHHIFFIFIIFSRLDDRADIYGSKNDKNVDWNVSEWVHRKNIFGIADIILGASEDCEIPNFLWNPCAGIRKEDGTRFRDSENFKTSLVHFDSVSLLRGSDCHRQILITLRIESSKVEILVNRFGMGKYC